MKKIFCIAALVLSAAQVQAADLGHYGSTFTIAEADLLHVIESKLKSYEEVIQVDLALLEFHLLYIKQELRKS